MSEHLNKCITAIKYIDPLLLERYKYVRVFYTHTHTHLDMFLYMHICLCMCACAGIQMFLCISLCKWIDMCGRVSVWICMLGCMSVHYFPHKMMRNTSTSFSWDIFSITLPPFLPYILATSVNEVSAWSRSIKYH